MDPRARQIFSLFILAFLLIPWILPYSLKSIPVRNIGETKSEMQLIRHALELHHVEHRKYPKSLTVLVKSGLIERDFLVDSWQNLYRYELKLDEIGQKAQNYFLASSGPDKKADTHDDLISEAMF